MDEPSPQCEELRKRIQALEEFEGRIQEFLAMLAHELRNPLAPIRNALSLMQMGGLSDSMEEWYRTVIDRQVTHLTRLVDDLLDVSRITNGKITLQKEPADMAVVVKGVADACRPLTDYRKQTFEVLPAGEPLWVDGDPTRLSQILVNLVNNAAKYTPEGGTIRLALERDGGEVLVRVRDTGVGIPADLLPRVFDLFTQGDGSLGRSEGGLGIGLALVRRLAEMHGGSVAAHSDGPGRGSEFIVRLPCRPAPAGSTGAVAAERPPPAVSRRLLVVDDNRDAADSLTVLLELWGHEVWTAYDGPAALALAAEHRPDAVLLDIGLPGMDGYEVARRLRELPQGEDAVLVAISGYGQDEDRRRCRESGFEHHLLKPVDPAQLASLLASDLTSSLHVAEGRLDLPRQALAG